jgi:hypothetical protein
VPRKKGAAAVGGVSTGTLAVTIGQFVTPRSIPFYALTYLAPLITTISGLVMAWLQTQIAVVNTWLRLWLPRRILKRRLKVPDLPAKERKEIEKALHDVDQHRILQQIRTIKDTIE